MRQVRDFMDAFLDQLAAGGVVADVTRLRTLKQPAEIARAWVNAPEGSRVVAFAAMAIFERSPGRVLVEAVLPSWDLLHVIDTGGVYIPGQPLRTVILVGRHAPPLSSFTRVLCCRHGEPRRPETPEQGVVWMSVRTNYDRPGAEDEWTRCADVPRSVLAAHPWSSLDGIVRSCARRAGRSS